MSIIGVVLVLGSLHIKRLTEPCKHVHRQAYAQPCDEAPLGLHRSLERDTDITNCPSAATGDYGTCLRSSLNHVNDGRVTYDTADSMNATKFFWVLRPRLLEPRPRSSIFNLFISDKPSFNVSRLTPTQREGLIMWSKCSYPPVGQTPTQPLNLSCSFQDFNLLFFQNTLSNGQTFGPTDQPEPYPVPESIHMDLLRTLSISAPLRLFSSIREFSMLMSFHRSYY